MAPPKTRTGVVEKTEESDVGAASSLPTYIEQRGTEVGSTRRSCRTKRMTDGVLEMSVTPETRKNAKSKGNSQKYDVHDVADQKALLENEDEEQNEQMQSRRERMTGENNSQYSDHEFSDSDSSDDAYSLPVMTKKSCEPSTSSQSLEDGDFENEWAQLMGKSADTETARMNTPEETAVETEREMTSIQFYASADNKWNSVAAARKYMFNPSTEVPLTLDVQKEIMNGTFKSKKQLDENFFLDIASRASGTSNPNDLIRELALGMAWTCATMNRIPEERASSPRRESSLQECTFKFDERAVQQFRRPFVTPSGVTMVVSDQMRDTICGGSTNRGLDKCVRHITKVFISELQSQDKWICAYTSPKTEAARTYIPLGRQFVENLTDFVYIGLRVGEVVQNPVQTKNRISACIQNSAENAIQKLRSKSEKTYGSGYCKYVADKLRNKLKKSGRANTVENMEWSNGIEAEEQHSNQY